jgi:predicted CXXCH cytochrome family protein
VTRLAGLVAAGAVVLGTVAPGASQQLRVHYPPDRQVVSGAGFLNVLIEADAGAEIEVRRAGRMGTRAVVRRGADTATVYHAGVELEPGVNSIEVLLRTGGREIATQRRVYFQLPLANETMPPPDFVRDPFHASPVPQACSACHAVAPGPDDAAPATPRQSSCFSCHARVTATPEVHGPASQWACSRCHDAGAAPARHATPRPVMPLCFGCHAEQNERFHGNRFQHGPTATGECTLCHNPHGTANLFFLKKAAWDLCTTCHAEKGTGRHVISWGPSGQTHPTRGRPDPSRPGREVSCASCHDPHAAPGPKLWKFGAVLYLDLCRNCHKAILGG